MAGPPTLGRAAHQRLGMVERCFERCRPFRAVATRHDETATLVQAVLDLTIRL